MNNVPYSRTQQRLVLNFTNDFSSNDSWRVSKGDLQAHFRGEKINCRGDIDSTRSKPAFSLIIQGNSAIYMLVERIAEKCRKLHLIFPALTQTRIRYAANISSISLNRCSDSSIGYSLNSNVCSIMNSPDVTTIVLRQVLRRKCECTE